MPMPITIWMSGNTRSIRPGAAVAYNYDTLLLSYDRNSDVLYIALNQSEAATCTKPEPGIVLRSRIADGVPCGVTLIGLQYWCGWWSSRRAGNLICDHLGIDRKSVEFQSGRWKHLFEAALLGRFYADTYQVTVPRRTA